MKKTKYHFKSIISLILSIIILFSNFSYSFADLNKIYINSVEDLIYFSKNASLDSYYRGKTILLTKDIDISNRNLQPIPTFGGVFDGQGYTISGLSFTKEGSVQGLFRYLQEEGIIKNLNISGYITPSGSQNIVGSLVGNNKGTIENCHFNGIVSGKNNIGGLVGINEATGIIANSTSEGKVSGEHFTGGVVGQNLGTIIKSINSSDVNTSVIEPKVNIADINWSDLNSMENLSVHTDTGGIAGFSSGFIENCINRGSIGYKHMGYNVGGIVGRQSGYVNSCKNYNQVLGRKDVGGIVGQVEPYLTLLFSKDTLQKLDEEINVLQNLLNQKFNNTRVYSSTISSRLSDILLYMDATKDNMEILSRSSTNYMDSIVNTVNITSDRIKYTLEGVIPILEESKDIFDSLNSSLNSIEFGFHSLESTSKELHYSIDDMKWGIENLDKSINFGRDAIYSIEDTLRKLIRVIENKGNIREVLDELNREIFEFKNAIDLSKKSTLKILNELKKIDINDPNFNIIVEELVNFSNNLNNVSQSLGLLGKKFSNLVSENIDDFLRDINKNFDNIFDSIYDSSKGMNRSIRNIYDALSGLQSTSKETGDAFNHFSKGFNRLERTSDSITNTIFSIKDLILSLVSQPDIHLPNVSSEFRQSGDDLFANIGHISNNINKLNEEAKEISDNLVSDIESIGNQIVSIFNVLTESKSENKSSQLLEDISEDNIGKNKLGTVYNNTNFGSLRGDINVGGIAGSIAIEYDIDPEDDIFKKGNPSLNFRYQSSAIVKECINHGKILSKENYVGGIAGRMDLGTITKSENYGDIESENGDYVGGIAGVSYSTILNSYTLASISGKNYIGGITGYGENISNSFTLINLKNGVEFKGTIAGDAKGNILNNHYVHNEIGAIDGISYNGKASPISYEELLEVENIPKAFSEFEITFIADGKIIEKIPFNYGDDFDLNELPNIPEKKGYESRWEDFNKESMCFNLTVEAIYTPLSTVISSNIVRNESNKPLILAEGKFRESDQIQIFPFDISKSKFNLQSQEILEAWSIELESELKENSNVKLRLLLPDEIKKPELFKLNNNRWEKVNSEVNGSYIVFPMEESTEFAVIEKSFSWTLLLITIFLIIIGFIFIKNLYNKSKNINKVSKGN